MKSTSKTIGTWLVLVISLWVLWEFHAESWHLQGIIPMTPGWFSTKHIFNTQLDCDLQAHLLPKIADCWEAGDGPDEVAKLDRGEVKEWLEGERRKQP